MKILLIVNKSRVRADACSAEICSVLTAAGAEWQVFSVSADSGRDDDSALHTAMESCDLVVTVGGDGTLLHSAPQAAALGKPILGVNVGRLGFLATVEGNETALLARLVQGSYHLDDRMMIRAEIENTGYSSDALNDVVISRGPGNGVIRILILCDGCPVSEFRGDGVILSTPTGSTAYSLAAGGPVLDARIGGILVTPICAHSLNTPPVVFSAERSIRVLCSEFGSCGAYLSADGRDRVELKKHDSVVISRSERRLSLVSFSATDQFRAIDTKLKGR